MMGTPSAPLKASTGGFNLTQALSDYRAGTKVYFLDENEGWVLGEAQENAKAENGQFAVPFILSNGLQRRFSMPIESLKSDNQLPPRKNPDFLDTVEDLSQLSYLNEPAVFWGIKNRFLMEQIYTYSGMVLIAMNPFAKIDIYSDHMKREYIGEKKNDKAPHVFGIAEECYRAMLQGKNQSVIVSGESGAGKTQSTKYIMQYLAVVDSLTKIPGEQMLMWGTESRGVVKSETEEAVLASNPILESFGNAKTTRNDNSSRFGKFVQLFFSDPLAGNVRITGAQVRTYLLERSRLIFQPATERNYHIFYQICAAAPAAERQQLGLEKWEMYHYLNQGNAGVVQNVNDIEEFKLTQEALSTLGIAVSKQWDIFRICAAILHIGNIEILDNESEGSVIPQADTSLCKACELLGISQAEFVKWVTNTQKVLGRDKYVKPLKLDMAIVSRDTVSKVIYSKLFDWLVGAINHNLKRGSTNQQSFIGVLDIYGFEHFKTNSFEQFCINYANEKLQQEFNAHVFRNEQELYVKEGIQWTHIDFSDNQECIDMIEQPRSGILALLDEESRLQNGSDGNFIDKLNTNFKDHAYYAKARFGRTDFTVKHYAVDVTYNSTGFMEKNKDNMSEELTDVLCATENTFLKQIFGGGPGAVDPGEEVYVAPKSAISERRKSHMGAPTLGSMFKDSLQGLMSTIRDTEGHYIRCIKPNMAKRPFEFESATVLSQLKACGVLETIKISNAAYPNKMDYDQFAACYDVLVPSQHRATLSKKDLTIEIVTSILTDDTKYQFGKSQVFLKSGQIAFFEDKGKERIQHYVSLFIKNFRRFVQRKQYLRWKNATLVLQTHIRGYLATKQLQKLIAEAAAIKLVRETERRNNLAATKIQSIWRGYLARKKYKTDRIRVIALQTSIRCTAARKTLKSLRSEAKDVAAVKDKAFALEAKVLALSESLREKATEAKKWRDKSSTHESAAASWKSKFEAADANRKLMSEEVTGLKKQLEEVMRKLETLSVERNELADIVGQATEDRLIDPPKKSGRSVSQSPSRQVSVLDRTVSRRGRPTLSESFAPSARTLSPVHVGSVQLAVSVPLPDSGVSPPSMSRTPTRSTQKPTKIGTIDSIHESIAAVRAENESLKRLLSEKGVEIPFDTKVNPEMHSSTIKPLGRGTSMRKNVYGQSIWERGMQEDSSPTLSQRSLESSLIPERGSSLKTNPQKLAELAQLLQKSNFNEFACDLLIHQLKFPLFDKAAPLPRKDVFFTSFRLSELISLFLEQGMIVELCGFMKDVCQSIGAVFANSNKDTSLAAFWTANTFQLLCLVAGIFNSEVKKPNNKAVINVLRVIEADLQNLFEYDLVAIFIKNLRDEVASLAVPAILEAQDLTGMRVEISISSLWSVFGTVASRPQENAFGNLIHFLANVHNCLASCYIPEVLHRKILSELVRTIGVVAFNGLLVKHNFLNYKRAFQIENNVNRFLEWCFSAGIAVGVEIQMVLQTAIIMKISKKEDVDVLRAEQLGSLLNASQIEKLYSNYYSKDPDSPMSQAFVDMTRSCADEMRNIDVVPLSIDPEPEYPLLTITPIDHCFDSSSFEVEKFFNLTNRGRKIKMSF